MSTRREFLSHTAAASLVMAASHSVASDKPAKAGASTPLKTYKVPNTDLVITRLAYGCAMLGVDWNSPDFIAKTIPTIRAAYDQGITFFDTADIYGRGKAEQALGEVLKASPGLRRTIVIQSKCGDRTAEGVGFDSSAEHITRSVDGSLQRLGTDHLDILLLHWPDDLVRPEEVGRAFDQLHRAGKVRHFGVSNHNTYQLELIQKHVHQPLVANQIQLGLAHWHTGPGTFKGALLPEGALTLDYCRIQGIQVQAYSPLRAGGAANPLNLLNPAPEAASEVKLLAQMLADMARKHEATPAALMLAWLLHHPAGIVPIIGATKPEHVVDNCAAERIELTRPEWYALLQAAANLPHSYA